MEMLPIRKRAPKTFFKLCLLAFYIFISMLAISSQFTAYSYADDDAEIEDVAKDIKETENKLGDIKAKADAISSTIKSLTGQINVNQSQINSLNGQIKGLTDDINNLNTKLDLKKVELDSSTRIRDKTVRNLYISNQQSLLEMLFSNSSLSKAAEEAAYHLSFIDSSKQFIGSLNQNIVQYESDKKDVETIKTQVETQKKEVQTLVSKLASQVNTSKAQLSNVSNEKANLERKLNELSAKQKSLLAAKSGTFTTGVGDVPSTGDPASQASYDPGFDPAFAGFSFGAPHRQGLSQYGAKGRAASGQDYKEILKAYYGDIEISKPDLPGSIHTDKGDMDLDGKYLKGLAEMPSDWPMDALKAQAIAARTYAMAYTGWRNNGGGGGGKICTTESCQVWSASKASSSSAARWHQAVEETKGMIMLGKDSDEIFSALYAASSGGYNYAYTSLGHKTKGGWDTKCGSRDCWTSEAYESKAGSPWFYKGWYKTRGGESCGRKHPWLTEKEFADIVGAVVLYKEDKDNQKHLSQTDAEKCWGEDIDDTWSADKVKEESGVSSVSDVNVTYSSGGETSEVKIKTNKGEIKVSGDDFKAIFNLRAPGAIQIKSDLFNIESK
jgi:SpoIID/LytB domain protein